MRNIAFPNLLKTLREYVLMTAGLLIYSFGWIACIKPMEVAAGGGTGLAMIVSHTAAEMWGVDIRIGTVFLTINAFLLLLSGLTVGWNFGFKTLFCIVVASGFMALMEPYFMVHYPPSGDVLGLDDKLLTIILGALLAGAGMAASPPAAPRAARTSSPKSSTNTGASPTAKSSSTPTYSSSARRCW